MAFGKRKSTPLDFSNVELPVGEDGRRRIIPQEVWEGESGEFMKRLGLTPDDPSNTIPNPEDLVAKYRRAEEAQRKQIELVNQKNSALLQGGDRLLPLYMVPLEVWDTDINITMMEAFELLPFEEWNQLWLPTGPMSALILKTFPHPGKEPDWMFDKALEFIRPCVDKLHHALRGSLSELDADKVNELMAIRQRCVAEIKAYAHTMKTVLAEQGTKNFQESIKAGNG